MKSECIVAAVILLATVLPRSSAAQTLADVNRQNSPASMTRAVFGPSNPEESQTPPTSQCSVRVIANDAVVSDITRREEAFNVLPAGIIPYPGQWPYFAWSDTQLGIVRTRDGSGYLFFGSDGACHINCGEKDSRGGSITVSTGSLDHPLGEALGDPNPPVREFLLPNSNNLPEDIDYVGGGPVYRVPEGEPGSGNLLLVYHAERPATPFWSWLGLARSTDEGLSWQDLGLIIGGNQPYNAKGANNMGDGNLLVATDAVTQQKYFYIYFGTENTFLSVARASYEELLAAISPDGADMPAKGQFRKYYNGQWNSPGLNGKAAEIFPAVTGQTDGDPQVKWSAYRRRFIAIEDNGQYIAYGESVDGLIWPPMQVLAKAPQASTYAYATPVGIGDDPAILGDTFYVYYTDWSKGVSWQPATLNRLTVTTAASMKTMSPSSTIAGGTGFTLTVNGQNFGKDSKLLWNSLPRATTYISANRLTAEILASDIEKAGTARIEISSPAPCGGISNAEVFTTR